MFIFLAVLIMTCLIVLSVCIYSYFKAKNTEKSNQYFLKKLQEKGFEITKSIEQGMRILAVDDKNSKWCIKVNDKRATKIYDYKDLIEFEVYQDGESIAKNNVAGAFAGAMLFGVAGAVGAQKKHKGVCTTLQLRIRIDSLNNPEIVLQFIDSAMEKDSRLYKNTFEQCKEMAATLTYIQNKAKTLRV